MRGSAAACGLARMTPADERPERGGASMKRFGLLLGFVLSVVLAAQAQDAGQFFDSNGVQIHYVDQGQSSDSSTTWVSNGRIWSGIRWVGQ